MRPSARAPPHPATLALVLLAVASMMVHSAHAAAAAGAEGSLCLQGLEQHRRGQLHDAMQLYLQGVELQLQRPRETALHMAPCMWGATLAFWAMARSQPDGAGTEWSDLAYRSALAHRRLLGEMDSQSIQRQQPSHQQRQLPLLTCDGARGLADLLVDDSDAAFHPRRVVAGSIVFVNAFLSDLFFRLHLPYIPAKFALITGCSDDESPGDWSHVAHDPRLVWWAAQNNPGPAPGTVQLPIGLPNRYDHGVLARAVERCEASRASSAAPRIILGIDENTHPERRGLTDLFRGKGVATEGGRVRWEDYMLGLCLADHALAPEGNGLDTHRFWECAAVGCTPVVVDSHPLLQLYECLFSVPQ